MGEESTELITLFSWGYWGWGTAATAFVRAVDAVESSRGCVPPLFVDVRMKRTVRAPGFKGCAFQELVGAGRYVWMRSLGNRPASDKHGHVELVDPFAAGQLLDLALDCHQKQQRLLFFCASSQASRVGKSPATG